MQVNGKPVVFLDNPGGTQVPQPVIDAIATTWPIATLTTVARSPPASAATQSSTMPTKPSPIC